MINRPVIIIACSVLLSLVQHDDKVFGQSERLLSHSYNTAAALWSDRTLASDGVIEWQSRFCSPPGCDAELGHRSGLDVQTIICFWHRQREYQKTSQARLWNSWLTSSDQLHSQKHTVCLRSFTAWTPNIDSVNTNWPWRQLDTGRPGCPERAGYVYSVKFKS